MTSFNSRILASASFAAIALSSVMTPAFAQDVPAVTGTEAQNCAALATEAEREACIEAQAEGAPPSGVVSDSPVESAEEAAVPDATGSTDGDAIVITGSRIRQNTYNSISPLQVLTTDNLQNVGQFDPAQILQRDEAASGTQIDSTLQGFVLNNGPGSQTVDLRGLGADRTLLLINGRRMAPAGVEGAPTNPSINLLPSSLIERYDLLLEGASSIYGSDAVAGVGNIILRKNFNGPELFASGNLNEYGAGNDYTVSGAWGKRINNFLFGVGAEYSYRDAIKLSDRDFFADCETHLEVDQNGNIRRVDLASNALVQQVDPNITTSESPCKVTSIGGRVNLANTRFGSVYFEPDGGNTPVPFFSETNYANGRNVDADGDGIRDIDLQTRNANNAVDKDHDFIPEQKLYNVMAYGEYTFDGPLELTPFFEANYSRAEIFSERNTGFLQLFPFVPATNPFNPCYRQNPNGVDCRAADNLFNSIQGPAPRPGLLSTGFDLSVQPIFAIRGDRNNLDVTQEQYRFVGGLKGNLPFAGPSWEFELAGVHSYSKGKSRRLGIREDKLAFALGLDPTADYNGDGIFDNDGDGIADDYNLNLQTGGVFGGPVLGPTTAVTPCNAAALDNPSAAMPDLLDGCVPVNLFAPSVLGSPIGDFATQAERDYLFGVRDFNTVYKQTLLSGYVTGDLVSLPHGDLGAVLGLEWRRDEIKSLPDDVASNGLFWGFFSDKGAVGSKDTKEAFAELDIPVFKNIAPLMNDLRFNVSGRLTDDEFYGTNFTYALKAGWRPVAPLLLKASYGTSFRAPNLRENFLQGQTGFNTIIDPCAVPDEAFDESTGQYVPALETRDQTTLDACIREGRDPTTVGIHPEGLNTINQSSAEIVSGGSLELDPETSRSITLGAAFAETFGNGINFSFGINYYNIRLKDSIIEPSAQFIVNDCFTRDDGERSPFCDRIEYGTTPASRGLVSGVFAGFLNLDQEKVRGLDLNGFIGKDISLMGRRVDLGLNLRGNRLLERSNRFIDDNGNETSDEDKGEFGYPKWTGRATFTAEVDKTWLFTWQTRYIAPVEQSNEGIDPLSDAFGRGPDGQPTGFIGDTCTGGGSTNGNVPGDGIFCRDVGFAGHYFVHAVSVRYRASRWEARIGITNLFDRDPPEVDGNEVFSISNVPVGNGYDLDGREFFGSIKYRF